MHHYIDLFTHLLHRLLISLCWRAGQIRRASETRRAGQIVTWSRVTCQDTPSSPDHVSRRGTDRLCDPYQAIVLVLMALTICPI